MHCASCTCSSSCPSSSPSYEGKFRRSYMYLQVYIRVIRCYFWRRHTKIDNCDARWEFCNPSPDSIALGRAVTLGSSGGQRSGWAQTISRVASLPLRKSDCRGRSSLGVSRNNYSNIHLKHWHKLLRKVSPIARRIRNESTHWMKQIKPRQKSATFAR